MKENHYYIEFVYDGIRYRHECVAFDVGITYPNCLTVYFASNARIIFDYDKLTELLIKPLKFI